MGTAFPRHASPPPTPASGPFESSTSGTIGLSDVASVWTFVAQQMNGIDRPPPRSSYSTRFVSLGEAVGIAGV
jgi:hypothetical protein